MEVCANFLWKTKSTTGKIVGNKLKFDEGGLTASYFLNLEIDFHLSGKRKTDFHRPVGVDPKLLYFTLKIFMVSDFFVFQSLPKVIIVYEYILIFLAISR